MTYQQLVAAGIKTEELFRANGCNRIGVASFVAEQFRNLANAIAAAEDDGAPGAAPGAAPVVLLLDQAWERCAQLIFDKPAAGVAQQVMPPAMPPMPPPVAPPEPVIGEETAELESALETGDVAEPAPPTET